MIRTRYIIPGVLLGGLLAVGGVASAFTGGVPAEVLDRLEFSDDQKAAITRAFGIKENAREEVRKVLDTAGVKPEEFHTVMREAHREHRDAVRSAIEANDYAAFREAVSDTPHADALTESVFRKLVEAHELREAGDYEGARTIMKELSEAVDMGWGHMGGMGHGPGKGGRHSMRGGW